MSVVNKRKHRSLSAIEEDLLAARKALDEAEKAASQARDVSTERRNAFNRLTKELDEAITALRLTAPWNTEWHRSKGEEHQ